MRPIFARQVALKLVGPERVTLHGPAVTGSEDFAFMLEKIPGSYLLIGNGDGDSAGGCMVHNPGYDFNDDNIAIGASYWGALVREFFAAHAPDTSLSRDLAFPNNASPGG